MSRLPLLVLSLTLVAAGAGAATFTVNRTTDAVDSNPGDGYCGGPLGPCSLRAAIQEANALPGADAIVLPAGTFTITIAGEGEDDAATGDLDVTEDLEITGAGASTTIVDGAELDRVLDLHQNGARPTLLRLRHVAVTRGAALTATTCQGGGIRVGSNTTLQASFCRIADNTAVRGGGIFLDGDGATADLSYSTLTGNSKVDAGFTASYGPAISDSDLNGERLALRSCTVSGNTSDTPQRYAIALDYATEVLVSDTTITGNSAGGVRTYSTHLTIVHSTIADNGWGGLSFGSFDASHSLTLVNTIIGGMPTCNIFNPSMYTHAGNLESADNCGLDTSAGEMVWTDPELGPLADNGGPTMTRLPNPGSPAIDAAAGAPHCTSPDQRGVSRPQDGDDDGIAACDIGAVEVVPEPPLFADGFESGDTFFWSAVAP